MDDDEDATRVGGCGGGVSFAPSTSREERRWRRSRTSKGSSTFSSYYARGPGDAGFRFVEVRVRRWSLSRRIGFSSALAERIEPGEFLGEDHAGTFGISLVVGWTGESVDEAEFLRAREAFDGHLAPRGGGPVARRLGVPQAHGRVTAKRLCAPGALTAVLLDASPDVHGDAAVQLPTLGLHDVHVPRLRGGGGERERRAHAGHGGARATVCTLRELVVG